MIRVFYLVDSFIKIYYYITYNLYEVPFSYKLFQPIAQVPILIGTFLLKKDVLQRLLNFKWKNSFKMLEHFYFNILLEYIKCYYLIFIL